jgi:hypothetical protein
MTRKPVETPKPQYFATINLLASLYVPIPDATSLADAAEKAAAIKGKDLWDGEVRIEDVFESETYVETVSGPSKGLK